ncbi:MAG: response regulator [Myxococcales bacterium]|jgi:two-component system chemotaxis response regulator CheY
MKILIVDDSKAMRMIVMRTLRQAGFSDHTIVEAANGVEALDAVKKSPPDLVLSDWNMPEMNGLELLKALRSAGNPVKFGFVTSEGTAEVKESAIAAGALFFVTKPFTPDTFKEALAKI